jgi:L-lactate dehydrogenase complex protein LldF
VLRIAGNHSVQKIIKSKSMITEEIELNDACTDAGLEIWESDLGEMIVQLAGEKPYHIVTPAMHKSRQEIAQLFHDRFGIPLTQNAQELTMAAREHLRETYITADMGITGANFLIAEEGAIVVTENEGNARLTMSCPPVHVVISGIEKLLPHLADLSLFLPLLATSGTGQQLTGYNSIIRGPRSSQEPDGPDHMYVILVDNGRSGLYARPQFRQALRCIRCGACLNVCPVYRTIGGHTYHTTYQGPIGAVITPHLRGMKKWNHLSFASSLCGACTDACPLQIDLHRLLLENRWEAHRLKLTGSFWDISLRFWSRVFSSRKSLDRTSRIGKTGLKVAKKLLPRGQRCRIPEVTSRSFLELWEKYEQQRKNS